MARQPAWIDYDGDGDLDLFAAFRDVPNRLLRNDEGRFVDVTESSGIGDKRNTVSGVWWDFDRDGDLDLFVANQEGEANGLYRQDRGRFEDVAAAMGVAGTPRPDGRRRRWPERGRLRSRRRPRFVRRQLRRERPLSQRGRQVVPRGVARERHRSQWPRRDIGLGRSRQRRTARPVCWQLHCRPAAISRCAVHQPRHGRGQLGFAESLPDVS